MEVPDNHNTRYT